MAISNQINIDTIGNHQRVNNNNLAKQKKITKDFDSTLKDIDKISTSKVNDSKKINHGIKIANKEDIKKFAIDFERNFMINMWTSALTNVIDTEKKDGIDIMYMPEFIEAIVKQSVGHEGGEMSSKIYESLEWKYDK